MSLGGSLLVPKEIDVGFLRQFAEFIKKKIGKKRRQFMIVVGGGKTARDYQEAVKKVSGRLRKRDVDWIGIYSTHLNCHLLRIIFEKMAYQKIIDRYEKLPDKIEEDVVLAAGGKPGSSTDYDAVLLAKKYKALKIINLSNIKMVYDRDPHKFADVKPIKKISWSDYLKLVGKKWAPGMSVPFDPVASKLAKELGLQVIICHGHDLENVGKILRGEKFVGTVIE